MKTKIVYVVASSDGDVYMEQAIVSAWSARYYNPDCHIEMVCDQDTAATMNKGVRGRYKDLFDDVHVLEFDSEHNMMERSRWMKTRLRQIIEGNYLYLDTDTVVCADLSYVDDFDFDIGMVPDCNCEFRNSLVSGWVIPAMKRMYDIDVSNETQYFNSGVAYVRDCQATKDFYEYWHTLWLYSLRLFNTAKDQQPLMKTNIDKGYVIRELPGYMNCQVAESIQYLHTAHVVHFFNNLLGKCNSLSPLFMDLFVRVKVEGLTDDIKTTILNCKSSFISPSMPVPREGAMLWRHYLATRADGLYNNEIMHSNSYYALCLAWKKYSRIMRFVEKVCEKIVGKHKKIVE